MREVIGQGGFQDLLRKLQRQFSQQTLTLQLDEDDLEKIPRYRRYEPGGYEDRLKPLEEPLRNLGLVPAAGIAEW
jgi:hypothetical protein